MPIEVTCPTCRAVLPAPDEFAGRQIRCADCKNVLWVPLKSVRAPEPSTPYSPPTASTPFAPPAASLPYEPGAGTIPLMPVAPDRMDEPEPRPKRSLPLWLPLLAMTLAAIGGAVALYFTWTQPPQPVPPPEVEPKPAVIVQKPPVIEQPPPLPSTIPGLKFHLAFEELHGQQVWESVAKKKVGTLATGAELEVGVHGKALKLNVPKREATAPLRYSLDLSDQLAVVTMKKGEPFAFCFWAKSVSPLYFFSCSQEQISGIPSFYSYRSSTGSTFLHVDATSALRSPNYRLTKDVSTDWHHYHFQKSQAGKLSLYLDGKPTRWNPSFKVKDTVERKEITQIDFDMSAKFQNWGFGRSISSAETATLLIDEVCWFDRDLNGTEITKLATKE